MPIYKLQLIKQETVANNTVKFIFEKPEGFQFVAGQYGGFTLINPKENDEKGFTRRFSLLCAPHDDHLSIVTRLQPSAFKNNLKNMSQGEEIKFAGPTGNFILHDDTSIPAALLAGGIGIAPFYSMIKHTLKNETAREIILFYGNQTLADSAFMDELSSLAKQHANFKFIPVLANPHPDWQGETGFITDSLVAKYIPDLDKPIFYACGSPAMVNAMQQLLRELAIQQDKIKVEDFPGY